MTVFPVYAIRRLMNKLNGNEITVKQFLEAMDELLEGINET